MGVLAGEEEAVSGMLAGFELWVCVFIGSSPFDMDWHTGGSPWCAGPFIQEVLELLDTPMLTPLLFFSWGWWVVTKGCSLNPCPTCSLGFFLGGVL